MTDMNNAMQDLARGIAQFGSSFPHITMKLKPLETPVKFDLNSQKYVESILFIGFLPLILLLVLMVALMVYYCVVNFSSEPKSGKKRCCALNTCCYVTSGVFIICFALFGLAGALFLCTPASEDIDSSISILDPAKSAEAINSAPDSHRKVKELLQTHGDDISNQLSADAKIQSKWNQVRQEFDDFQSSDFPGLSTEVQLTQVTYYLKTTEQYRYWTSIALFSFYSLISILSFVGICLRSKCMIIGITCALFFALAICHLSLYAQLAGGIVLSDYCINPKDAQGMFISIPDCDQAQETARALGSLKGSLEEMQDVFTKELLNSLSPSQSTPAGYTSLKEELASMLNHIEGILGITNCDTLKAEYEKITKSFCGDYIVGWWIVLLASLVISILIAQLLFFAPCVWRSFEAYYQETSYGAYDESQPFVRGITFQRPVYPQRQSVTLSFLRQSNDDLNNFSSENNHKQPPPVSYSSFS